MLHVWSGWVNTYAKKKSYTILIEPLIDVSNNVERKCICLLERRVRRFTHIVSEPKKKKKEKKEKRKTKQNKKQQQKTTNNVYC